MKERLLAFCQSIGLSAVGIASWPLPDAALTHLYEENPCPFTHSEVAERLHGNTALKNPKSAIVCLFPYYAESKGPVNLARYTWGIDYHLVVPLYLDRIISFLRNQSFTEEEFEIHCDTSPLADRYIAHLAGLGFYGKNHCLIHPVLGSYFVIGTILTSLSLPPCRPLEQSCMGCNRCIASCPGQAIGAGRFLYNRCKSYLTQKKGDLASWEEEIIAKSPLVFGCDICQEVCPHNKNLPVTDIKEFVAVDPFLMVEELEHLSNREFAKRFNHRAFSWRGKKVLLRNAHILSKKP